MDDVEFSAEDAGELISVIFSEIVETAIEAGATTVNIPDYTCYTMLSEFGKRLPN